jgi:hypothetical protein
MINELQKDLKLFVRTKEGRMLGYMKDLAMGQLVKFDLFNDICFIMTAFYCGFDGIAIVALIISACNIFFQLVELFKFILGWCLGDTSQELSTKYIG